MRFIRRTALLLGIIFMLAAFSPAAAADITTSELEQYAAELTQYTSLKYYKSENTGRYIDYMSSHPDLDWETVVTHVNIGLDNLFYTNTAAAADPAALNVLVNKYHPLPADFAPENLEAISSRYSAGTLRLTHDARAAFEKMCADAKKLGYSIYAVSAYRSYDYQRAIYDSFYDPGNPDSALYQEQRAARPGYSEHQTGLAVDIAQIDGPLTGSEVFKWYSKNAHKYGFIVRYPEAMDTIVGYSFEPWHLRYLGTELAAAVYKSGLTYDEYYAKEIDVTTVPGEAYAVGVTAQDTVTVDSESFTLSTYDVLGDTYFKLRDIAAVLNGSLLQFDITWEPPSEAAPPANDPPSP